MATTDAKLKDNLEGIKTPNIVPPRCIEYSEWRHFVEAYKAYQKQCVGRVVDPEKPRDLLGEDVKRILAKGATRQDYSWEEELGELDAFPSKQLRRFEEMCSLTYKPNGTSPIELEKELERRLNALDGTEVRSYAELTLRMTLLVEEVLGVGSLEKKGTCPPGILIQLRNLLRDTASHNGHMNTFQKWEGDQTEKTLGVMAAYPNAFVKLYEDIAEHIDDDVGPKEKKVHRGGAPRNPVERRHIPRQKVRESKLKMEACSGCGRDGHREEKCWTLHPNLRPTKKGGVQTRSQART